MITNMVEGDSDGGAIQPGHEPMIGEGVRGLAFNTSNGIYIPLVFAVNQGSGQVSKWLDELPRDRRVVFPNVMNPKLAAMLRRRDFVVVVENDETFGPVECMERNP